MSLPKVSIIVPIYNTAQYLERCMDSLLNQTLRDIEIILVDDESPDRAPQMCDEYARKDPRVKVIHKKNGGLGFARNSGLEIATGEYVAFVDSDDYVKCDMYEALISATQEGRVDAVLSNYSRVSVGGGLQNVIEVQRQTFFEGSDSIYTLMMDMISTQPRQKLDRLYSVSVWRGVYRRRIIEDQELKFLSERDCLSEDMPFHASFFSCSNSVTYLPDCFYCYCDNQGSLTKAYREGSFERISILVRNIKDVVLRAYPEKHEDINLRLNRLLVSYVRSMLLRYDVGLKTLLQICSNEELYNAAISYPSSDLPFKYRFFYTLIRARSGGMMKVFFSAVRLLSNKI